MKNYFLHPVVVRANGKSIAKAINYVNSLSYSSDREKMQKFEALLTKYGSKLQEGPLCQVTTNYSINASNFSTKYLGIELPIICKHGDIIYYLENGKIVSKYCSEGEIPDQFSYVLKLSQPNFLEPLLNQSEMEYFNELSDLATELFVDFKEDTLNYLDYDQIEDWKREFSSLYKEILLLKNKVLKLRTIDGIGCFHTFIQFEMVLQELTNILKVLNEFNFVIAALAELDYTSDSREKKKWLRHYFPLYKRITEFANTHLYFGQDLFEEEPKSGMQLTFNPIKVKDESLSTIMEFLEIFKSTNEKVSGKYFLGFHYNPMFQKAQ